jgi:penicillin-binding protein 2
VYLRGAQRQEAQGPRPPSQASARRAAPPASPSPQPRLPPSHGPKARPLPVSHFDPTAGDNVDGDDLEVRRAAVDALGPYNGTVVVVDPQTGRVLTIVNQKTALDSGFTPCSTIKLVTAFAALNEGLIGRDTPVQLTRRTSLDLSSALAHSNNPYFKILGDRLGYQRVVHYATLFGLGEKAGWQIPGERPGLLPGAPPEHGGVGMMTAYGEGIQLTPLELAALVSAIANGGTFTTSNIPRARKRSTISSRASSGIWISRIGLPTSRSACAEPWTSAPPTAPASISRSLSWARPEPATIPALSITWAGSALSTMWSAINWSSWCLLTGGFRINGPIAAGVAGSIYKQLSQENFFAAGRILSTQICCTR